MKVIFYCLILILERLFPTRDIAVILYHRIDDDGNYSVKPELFEKQLKHLKKLDYVSISPEDLKGFLDGKINLSRRSILITFDDGFKDNYSIAYPLLKKYNFTATFFISARHIGKLSDYSEKIKNKEMMSFAELSELIENGFTVANHFYSHRNLTEISDQEIESEFNHACEILSNIVNSENDLKYVAYPRNRTTSNVFATLKKVGVKLGFGGNPALVSGIVDYLNIPRIEIFGNNSVLKFRVKISGHYYRLINLFR